MPVAPEDEKLVSVNDPLEAVTLDFAPLNAVSSDCVVVFPSWGNSVASTTVLVAVVLSFPVLSTDVIKNLLARAAKVIDVAGLAIFDIFNDTELSVKFALLFDE